MAYGSVNVPGASAAALKKIAETAAAAAKTAGEAMDAVQDIVFQIKTVPAQIGIQEYTGRAIEPQWTGYNPEQLEIGGTLTGTAAGTYEATFTPKGKYNWETGGKDPKTVTWKIERATITSAPRQTGTLTYTGSPQSPEWTGYDSGKMTIGGTQTATDAGEHKATFTPTANYRWSDGSASAWGVNWEIKRAIISQEPAQSGSLTYTGGQQSPKWTGYDPDKMTIGGTQTATNAGAYSTTFTPTRNYAWSGGSSSMKSIRWTIARATGSMSLSTSSMTLTKAAMSQVITVTRAGDGAVTARSNNTDVATVSVDANRVTVTGKSFGSATITITVEEGTNHTSPGSRTCSVQVNVFSGGVGDNTWDAIHAASISGEAKNNWKIGNTKRIEINGRVGNKNFSHLQIDVYIIGFDHNASREGSGKTHFKIGKIGGVQVALCDDQYGSSQSGNGYFNMNPNNSNSGGWRGCYHRNTLLGNSQTPTNPLSGSLMAALPKELRMVMVPVTKYTDNTGGGQDNAGYVTATTDYLFELSEFEYHGSRTYANSAEQNYQQQYEYYRAGNSKVHYQHKATGSTASVWCRSPYYGYAVTFCLLYTSGGAGGNDASSCCGVAPGFAA